MNTPPNSGDQDDFDASRTAAALNLLKPDQIQESLAVAEPPSVRNAAIAGLQVAVASLIVLPITHLSPWPHLLGYASLGALAALFGRFATRERRPAIVAQCGFWLAFAVLAMSMAAYLGVSEAALLLIYAALSGLFLYVVITSRLGGPGALIFMFAAGASMSAAASWREVGERVLATAVSALVAWLVCVVSDHWRKGPQPGKAFPVDEVPPLDQRLLMAGRFIVGTAVSGIAVYAAGAHHPAWAILGTGAVMQSTHLHMSMSRALQRMAGTTVGACIVWAILSQNPSTWWIIGLVAFIQFITEVIIGYNYGLGQIMVTPMALLMSYLAAPPGTPIAGMAPERVLDTIVGISVGMVLAVIFSSLEERARFLRHRKGKRSSGI